MEKASVPKLKGYIHRRHRTWYAALDIPKDVRPKFGRKPRFVTSLKTDSERRARILAAPIVADWKAQIEAARGNDPDLVEKFRDALGSDALHVDIKEIARLRKLLDLAKSKEDRDVILERITDIADLIAPTSEDNPEGDDPEALALARRVYGIATGIATDAHIDDWLAGVGNEPKSKDLKRSDLRRLTAKFPTLDLVTRKDVNALARDMILKDHLARATVNRALSSWRGYWRYLQDHEIVPDDIAPFTDITVPSTKSAKAEAAGARLPFEPADVVRLWREAEAREDFDLADLIKMAAYTGARREELAGLTVDRVDFKRGVIRIEDAKTKAGNREVPIHPELRSVLKKRIGNRSKGFVLSSLESNKYGKRGDAVGRRFGRLRTALGFNDQYVFHCIRNTTVAMLINAGVPDIISQAIHGHKNTSMTGAYGQKGVSLEVKAKAIRKLRYPTK